jgi:outer membrane protein assembly factor BamB
MRPRLHFGMIPGMTRIEPAPARAGRAQRGVGARLIASTMVLAVAVGACSPVSPTSSPPATAASSPTASPSLVPSPNLGQASGPPSTGEPSAPPSPTAELPTAANPFPNGLLIADRGNGRLIVLNPAGKIIWTFPTADSFARPTPFNADDAFFSPDGRTITANDEGRHVIYRIDVATRKVIWSYGHLGVKGSAPGYLNTPDDAYGLANGDIVVADINNCRVLEIAPDKTIVRQWGRTLRCTTNAPTTYGAPNGDTPLPDGGLLITQIHGSRVDRLSPTGELLWEVRVPISYPSDAQLDGDGNIVVAGFTNPGTVVGVTPTGKLLWRYAPTSGPGRLNHPSLAMPLGNGLVSVNDDDRNRMVVIDTTTLKIVWQYGVTGVAGALDGYLSDPDGHEPVPANVVFP